MRVDKAHIVSVQLHEFPQTEHAHVNQRPAQESDNPLGGISYHPTPKGNHDLTSNIIDKFCLALNFIWIKPFGVYLCLVSLA